MKKAGFVTVVGRPNVGKSTFINHFLGEKISITSRRPQTTRHQIVGVHTKGDTQIVFVDTPGIHHSKKALNKLMNEAALSALHDVDLVLMMVEAGKWTEEDTLVAKAIGDSPNVILLVNKIDRYKDKSEMLPFLAQCQEKINVAHIIPLSAKNERDFSDLEQVLCGYMPESEDFFYPEDKKTQQGFKFRIAEIIREKIMRSLSDELPFSTAVEIENIEDKEKTFNIHALIFVERDSQKPIVIGKGGATLKKIGTSARADIEKVVGKQVHLKLWVKVRSNWSDSLSDLKNLGYSDFDSI